MIKQIEPRRLGPTQIKWMAEKYGHTFIRLDKLVKQQPEQKGKAP